MKIITYNIHKGMDAHNKDTLNGLLSFLKNKCRCNMPSRSFREYTL